MTFYKFHSVFVPIALLACSFILHCTTPSSMFWYSDATLTIWSFSYIFCQNWTGISFCGSDILSVWTPSKFPKHTDFIGNCWIYRRETISDSPSSLRILLSQLWEGCEHGINSLDLLAVLPSVRHPFLGQNLGLTVKAEERGRTQDDVALLSSETIVPFLYLLVQYLG